MATQQHQRLTDVDTDYDEQFDDDLDFRRATGKSLGHLPWWIASATVHSVLLLLAMLIVLGARPIPALTEDVPHAKIVTEPPKKEKPVTEHKIKAKSQVNIEAESDRPFYTPEKLEVTESSEYETENEERSEFPARGQQDAVSTVPAEGTGTIGFFGVGSGGAAGAFGWRSGGGRRRRAMRFGGSQATENAVDLGLEWLKWHQEEDGRWDRKKYGGQGAKNRTFEFSVEDTGVTALAALAFLGAGHTERHGKYRNVVRRSVAWLIKNQNENGRWNKPGKVGRYASAYMYRNAIATLALSEAAGMGNVPETTKAAQKAVDGLVAVQKPYAAWDYKDYRGEKHKHENDTSITIWCAMALKSAKVAGLKVPGTSFDGILKWVDHAQDLTGGKPGDYNYQGGLAKYRGKLDGEVIKSGHDELLTAGVGVIRIFWGQNVDHPGVVGPCNYLLAYEGISPVTSPKDFTHYYAWYYATLLMFQKGGDHWQKWNDALRPRLLAKQLKGDPRQMGGSWDPNGPYIEFGGRVFSTSLAVLTLEVYYRYLRMYDNK